MIQTDLHITGLAQAVRNRARLLVALQAVGQPVLLDLALMLLEGRHMRVAEHRETIGLELDAARDGVEAGGDRLVMPEIPARRRPVVAASVCSKLCMRLMARCTFESKLCTPRLARLTPPSASASIICGVSVRGSISIAISAEGVTKKQCRISPIRSVKDSGAMMVGVPPPKWMCSTPMRRSMWRTTCSISQRSADSYTAIGWSRFATVVWQPQ
jgi:hypothetical protein